MSGTALYAQTCLSCKWSGLTLGWDITSELKLDENTKRIEAEWKCDDCGAVNKISQTTITKTWFDK